MKMKIFSVYDVKSEAFMTPIFTNTVGQAIRSFSDAVMNKESQFNKHPEDYTLFQIGEYDDSNAQITPTHPNSIMAAIELNNIKEEK